MNLQELFNKFRYRLTSYQRHDDTYARNREALWQALQPAVRRQTQNGKAVWLVTHFQETFETVQDCLADWQIEYQIVMNPVVESDLVKEKLLQPGRVQLVLAPLLFPYRSNESTPVEVRLDRQLAVMVVERHPKLHDDLAIEAFCRQCPVQTELGYFLALDDPLVQTVVDPTSLIVLEQLGLDQHDLITSNMITGRLNRKLKQQQAAAEQERS